MIRRTGDATPTNDDPKARRHDDLNQAGLVQLRQPTPGFVAEKPAAARVLGVLKCRIAKSADRRSPLYRCCAGGWTLRERVIRGTC